MTSRFKKKLSDEEFARKYINLCRSYMLNIGVNRLTLSSPYLYLKRFQEEDKKDYWRFYPLFEWPSYAVFFYALGNVGLDMLYQLSSLIIIFINSVKSSSYIKESSLIELPEKFQVGESTSQRCLIISHLNHLRDIYAEYEFYYPGLEEELVKNNLVPEYLYTNKPGLHGHYVNDLSIVRNANSILLKNRLPLKHEIHIAFDLARHTFWALLMSIGNYISDQSLDNFLFSLLIIGQHRACLPNLRIFYAVKSLLSTRQYDHLIYPYEGNSWESMIVFASSTIKSLKVSAYCHSLLDTCSHTYNPLLESDYCPQHYLISHQSYKKCLIKSTSKNSAKNYKFTLVGFSSLTRSIRSKENSELNDLHINNCNVLFAPDGFVDKSLDIVQFACRYCSITGSKAIVCIHPTVYDEVISRANSTENVYLLKGPIAASQINQFSTLVFQTSTVSLIAAAFGLRTIAIMNPEDKPLNTLSDILPNLEVALDIDSLISMLCCPSSGDRLDMNNQSSGLYPLNQQRFAASLLE